MSKMFHKWLNTPTRGEIRRAQLDYSTDSTQYKNRIKDQAEELERLRAALLTIAEHPDTNPEAVFLAREALRRRFFPE